MSSRFFLIVLLILTTSYGQEESQPPQCPCETKLTDILKKQAEHYELILDAMVKRDENLKKTLNDIYQNLQMNTQDYLDYTEENIQKKLKDLDKTFSQKFKEQNLKLDTLETKFSDMTLGCTVYKELVENINTSEVNQNEKYILQTKIDVPHELDNEPENLELKSPESTEKFGCKNAVIVTDNKYFQQSKDLFKDVTISPSYSGGSDPDTFYEMRFAVKSAEQALIKLSSWPNTYDWDVYFEIEIKPNVVSLLRRKQLVATGTGTLGTSHISPDTFTMFHLKIYAEDGYMKFGKEGSSPIIRHVDPYLKYVKYFDFASTNATILYDCPPEEDSKLTDLD